MQRFIGFIATQEYKGKGWRADVFAVNDSKKFAFEIQISPQSLKKTLERQKKYSRDEIVGCWLFEKPPAKLSAERPDLPLFYVIKQSDNSFSVSLSGRKELPLHIFLEQFLTGNIRFCEVARTTPEQTIRLVFFEMECWKCKKMNHIYYVDTNFHSACNATIYQYETLWGSPNHMHGIIVITDGKGTAGNLIGLDGESSRCAPTQEQFQKPVKGSIPTMIRSYKSAVSYRINLMRKTDGVLVWQRNYYEHVMRNQTDLQNKTDYIEANPLLWDEDDENPINSSNEKTLG